jgi:hypothetical protein
MIIKKDRGTMLPIGFTRKADATLVRDGQKSTFAILEPFGNCQTFAMGYVNTLISQNCKYNSNEAIYNYYNIALEFVKYTSCTGKRQVMIDIHTGGYEKVIDHIFKDAIVFKQPYKSTNGSSMCIYLLLVQGAIDFVNKQDKIAIDAKQAEVERIISQTGIIPEFKLPEYWYVEAKNKEEWAVICKHYNRQWTYYAGNCYVGKNDSYFNEYAKVNSSEIIGFTALSFSEWETYVVKKV